MERGYFQDAIGRAAYEHQQMVERGERTVVGVNRYTVDEPPPAIPAPDYSRLATRQSERLQATRSNRNAGAHASAVGRRSPDGADPSRREGQGNCG